jgi:hypothetical protein
VVVEGVVYVDGVADSEVTGSGGGVRDESDVRTTA